jgi:predicted dehydrogenase
MISVHEVDLALWLFGPAESVSIHRTHTGKTRICDGFAMLIKHRSGVLTTINSSWHSLHYSRGYRLVYANGDHNYRVFLSPEDDTLVNKSYETMLDHWLKHIEEGNPLVEPNLEDGYAAYTALQGGPYVPVRYE